MLFCILAHILSNIESILIKYNVFCPEKVEKLNESNIFKVSEIFPGVFECVLVQMLLIHTLFSVQFYIRMKAILSSIR